jgi:hypothetical protein
MPDDKIITYYGKPVDDLSRDELIDAIKCMAKMVEHMETWTHPAGPRHGQAPHLD